MTYNRLEPGGRHDRLGAVDEMTIFLILDLLYDDFGKAFKPAITQHVGLWHRRQKHQQTLLNILHRVLLQVLRNSQVEINA